MNKTGVYYMVDKIVIVRVRGIRNITPKIGHALYLLRLSKPNHCVVLNASPQNLGMINIVRDYVAYGKMNEETLIRLLSKRGEVGRKLLREIKSEEEIKKIAKEILNGKKTGEFADPVFRLHPPRKGYKDIKKSFPFGDLGKRTDMDQLIKRMI